MQRIAILGATGSIGESTLEVAALHPERFSVFALTANRNIARLAAQIRRFRPQVVAVPDAAAARTLRDMLDGAVDCQVEIGPEALVTIAALPEVTTVMAAIVGAAGLPASIAAARAGKRVLLANKEALVMAGQLFMDAVREGGATLLPIDSEHSAIFQSLPREFRLGDSGSLGRCGVRRIVLTASGGPFRTLPIEQLPGVTPEQAVAHPNWVMGRKISVDSASMMNKGLEVIEAHWLFAAPVDKVQVVIHPQSVIHSMVEYLDGSFLAQLGQPDMRTPIACGLAYPERVVAGVADLDFTRLKALEFMPVEHTRFPCVRLAYDALVAGGTAPAVLNAANEVAVDAFLAGQIAFPAIAETIDAVLQATAVQATRTLDVVYSADREARTLAAGWIARERNALRTLQ